MIIRKTILVSAYMCMSIFANTPFFQVKKPMQPAKVGTQNITVADNNKVISVKVGTTLVLKFKENASTGYAWYFQQLNDKAFKTLSDQNITDSASKGLVGASTTRTIHLQTKTKGKFTLQLKNYRQWEGPATAVQSFQITVLTK